MRRVIKTRLNYRFCCQARIFFLLLLSHWNWKLFFHSSKTKAASINVQSQCSWENPLDAITKLITNFISFSFDLEVDESCRDDAQLFKCGVRKRHAKIFHGWRTTFPWISFFVPQPKGKERTDGIKDFNGQIRKSCKTIRQLNIFQQLDFFYVLTQHNFNVEYIIGIDKSMRHRV